MSRAPACAVVLLALLPACDGDGSATGPVVVDAAAPDAEADGSAAVDAGAIADAGVDPTEAVFGPARLLQIDIELPEADWDTLRHQTRSLFDVLGPDCLEAPAERPFTWFEATVTVDGERVERVGVRKKGFIGSLSEVRPSLKVKFDRYREGLRWSGMRRLTLNNNRQDPSQVRQCLGYAVFAAAGVPSPRCNFARVSVNGEPLGVYTHVESVKSAFLDRAFGNRDGHLYEGQISDFRSGWTGTFQRKNGGDPGHGDIDAVVAALEGPEDGLLERLEPLLDVDAFLTFWAAEVVVGHGDGYAGNTNNFYVYADPAAGGAFHFVPWGIDGIMRDARRPPVFANGALAWRLLRLPGFTERYVDRVSEVLGAAWDADAMLAEIDRLEALLSPHVLRAEALPGALEEVRGYVSERGLQLSLALGVPLSVPPQLRPPICFTERGEATVRFETTWGTFPESPPTSTGRSEIEVDGPDPLNAVGGAVVGLGVQGEEQGRVVLLLVAERAGGLLGVHTLLDPAQLREGVVTLDGSRTRSVVFEAAGGRQPQPVGFVEGEVVFEAADSEPGAEVRGQLTGTLLNFGR